MLSRIAESLFWIGRYVDRADNTARLLDLHFNVLLEDPWVDEPTANASLLQVDARHSRLHRRYTSSEPARARALRAAGPSGP